MNARELQPFRRRLVEMARRLGGERLQLRHEALGDARDGNVSTTQEQHTNDDLSRENAEEEIALAVLDNEEVMLRECLAALGRIDNKTFGKCERCSHAIAKARLEAAPYARHCIKCARMIEQESE